MQKSNTEDILSGNRLIAEFMGAKEMPQDKKFNAHLYFDQQSAPSLFYVENDRKWHTKQTEYRVALLDLENLQYHTSWDWLMPVVEKINKLAIDDYGEMGVWIFPNRVLIGEDEHNPITMVTIANHPILIDMTWTAVKTFLFWYNKTQQNEPR